MNTGDNIDYKGKITEVNEFLHKNSQKGKPYTIQNIKVDDIKVALWSQDLIKPDDINKEIALFGVDVKENTWKGKTTKELHTTWDSKITIYEALKPSHNLIQPSSIPTPPKEPFKDLLDQPVGLNKEQMLRMMDDILMIIKDKRAEIGEM